MHRRQFAGIGDGRSESGLHATRGFDSPTLPVGRIDNDDSHGRKFVPEPIGLGEVLRPARFLTSLEQCARARGQLDIGCRAIEV